MVNKWSDFCTFCCWTGVHISSVHHIVGDVWGTSLSLSCFPGVFPMSFGTDEMCTPTNFILTWKMLHWNSFFQFCFSVTASAMAYNITCIINGDTIELDPMDASTKLSDLLTAIQRKSGIPKNRQQLMGDAGNVPTDNLNATLLSLNLSNTCHFLVLDSEPDGDLEILASPKANEQSGSNPNNADDASNDPLIH